MRLRLDGCDTVGVYKLTCTVLARDKNSRVEMRRDACGTMMFLCLRMVGWVGLGGVCKEKVQYLRV